MCYRLKRLLRMAQSVYHYTSLDALVGILKREEIKDFKGKMNTKSSLVFWGSRYDCMNDPQDYLFASKVGLWVKLQDKISRDASI